MSNASIVNASVFYDKLLESVVEAKSQNSSTALLLIGISNLAMIISAHGHQTSEAVMQELTQHIRGLLREGDVISRLQRDQIGIIVHHCYPEDTEQFAARIIHLMQNYGRDHFLTAALHLIGHIGSVHIPAEAENAEDALDKAYVALHSLKGKPYIPYTVTRDESDWARQQMGLANYLYNAYKEDRLRMAWQPVIEAGNGEIHHYEALLRMVGPSGKITSAGALIPIAEQMGLIESIDMLVLDRVMVELEKSPNLNLAFNVSNITTESTTWLDYLASKIENKPEIASRMTVEITETAVHRDLRRVAFFVASVQSLGCQVALDDFGSGYTSFRQLKALSVDSVKIDGVFIKDLAENADNRFFVKTLLDFTRGFGLKAVAEFVENGETVKILMDMGIDYMQGFYLGRPETHRTWLNDGEYKAD